MGKWHVWSSKSNDLVLVVLRVAIGELADGLEIDLDKVPLKYKVWTVQKLLSQNLKNG